MSKEHHKRRMIGTCIAMGLLMILYAFIFGFSAQDAEESGNLSMQVSRFGTEFWNTITGRNWSEQVIGQIANFFEHFVRKSAHFGEYAAMGVLIAVIVSYWVQKAGKRNLLIVLWVAFSAAMDEFHQAFVPGRYCSLKDVLLDICGGIIGAWICISIMKRNSSDGDRRKTKKENK